MFYEIIIFCYFKNLINQVDRNNKLFVIGIITGGLLFYILPEAIFYSGNSLCLHYRIFGIECPFCGLTRAGFSFFHFQFSKGMHLNPAILPLMLFIVSEIFRRYTRLPIFVFINKILLVFTAIAFIALYITRILKGFV